MLPLPAPEPGKRGSLEPLKKLIPTPNDEIWQLLQIWLVTAFIPDIPRPGIILHGSQGAGKSSATKILRALVDPSTTPLLSLPKNPTEMAQVLYHHYIMALDNLQQMSQWASDGLCKAVTGSGFSKRTLYTDEDDTIFKFIRTFILNGINLPGTSPDLLDRSILIELARIEKRERKPEKNLMNDFAKIQPNLFAVILDTLKEAIKNYPNVKIDSLPRMADWATWGYAVAEALGIGGEKFLEIYEHNILLQHQEVVFNDPVAFSVYEYAPEKNIFSESPSRLYEICKKYITEDILQDKSWPKGAHVFSKRLKVVQHSLRKLGVIVEFYRGKTRTISVRRVKDKNKRRSCRSCRDKQ